MAHYAFLDENNIVTHVIVGRDEGDLPDGVTDWETYYGELMGQACKRTSYNSRGGVHSAGDVAFRYNYAGIGYEFDPDRGDDGAFIPTKPFESWVLDDTTCLWEAPVAKPDDADTVDYYWDEEAIAWAVIPPMPDDADTVFYNWSPEAGDWVAADE